MSRIPAILLAALMLFPLLAVIRVLPAGKNGGSIFVNVLPSFLPNSAETASTGTSLSTQISSVTMRGKSTADIVSSQLSPPVVERVSATSSSISNNTACAQFSFLYVILRSGLTNQELEISKGVLLARMFNVSLLVPTVVPTFNQWGRAPVSLFYDEDALSKRLAALGVTVSFDQNLFNSMNSCIVQSVLPPPVHGGYVASEWIAINSNWSRRGILQLNWPFQMRFPPDAQPLLDEVMRALHASYSPALVRAAEFVADTSFDACVHLRFESDMIRWQQNVQQPERCDSSYRKALAEFAPPNRNATVYVAVGEENRAVRRQLGLLSSAYNVVRKRDLVPAALLPSVREALAIVDKLICLRARAFIGFVCSTYSVWIAKQFEWSKRPAKLVHCCEIVS